MIPFLASLIKTDDNVYAALFEVKSMSVSLAAVANDSNGLSFELVDVAVCIIIDFWHFNYLQSNMYNILGSPFLEYPFYEIR